MNINKNDESWILKILWLALFGEKEIDNENKNIKNRSENSN